jgi:hypothetical protein
MPCQTGLDYIQVDLIPVSRPKLAKALLRIPAGFPRPAGIPEIGRATDCRTNLSAVLYFRPVKGVLFMKRTRRAPASDTKTPAALLPAGEPLSIRLCELPEPARSGLAAALKGDKQSGRHLHRVLETLVAWTTGGREKIDQTKIPPTWVAQMVHHLESPRFATDIYINAEGTRGHFLIEYDPEAQEAVASCKMRKAPESPENWDRDFFLGYQIPLATR